MKSNVDNLLSHSPCNINKKFNKVIPKNILQKLMGNCERVRVYDPLTTIKLFLLQASHNYSCKGVLSIFNFQRAKSGSDPVSMNTGAYSRAKKLLDENLLRKLSLEAGAKANSLGWKNRDVKIIDGSTMQMEDTISNQNEYPQHVAQKEGLGQPILRSLNVFSHSTGRIVDVEIASYSGKGTAEPSLLRKMINRFTKGDVLLMDRFFTSYFLHNDLIDRGVDFVVRLKNSQGEKYLKVKDKNKEKIVKIKRPKRTENLSHNEYYYYPEKKTFRVIKYISKKSGFRDKVFYIMTSLKDVKMYQLSEIANLYKERWNVEINIRNLKRTLGAHFLKSKTPSMVRKELYMIILAYNLVRSLILLIAEKEIPQNYSFKTMLFYLRELLRVSSKKVFKKMQLLLKNETLKSRFRIEPRALKRRTRGTYGLLMIKRTVWKEQIVKC